MKPKISSLLFLIIASVGSSQANGINRSSKHTYNGATSISSASAFSSSSTYSSDGSVGVIDLPNTANKGSEVVATSSAQASSDGSAVKAISGSYPGSALIHSGTDPVSGTKILSLGQGAYYPAAGKGGCCKGPFPGPNGSIYDFKPAPPGGGGFPPTHAVPVATPASSGGVQTNYENDDLLGVSGLSNDLINSLPGLTGSIYDSKPATQYNAGSSHTESTHGLPIEPSPPSNNKPSISSFPGQSGSIYDSKPIGGCSGQSCTGDYGNSGGNHGQLPSLPGNNNKPSIILDINSLPGQQGSIHNNKPVHDCSGSSCPGSYGNSGGTHSQQPSPPGNSDKPSSILDIHSFPSQQGSIHDNKPVTDCSGSSCPGNYGNYGGTFAPQPSLPSNNRPSISSFPGQPGSIHDSKPIGGCSGQPCTGGYGNSGGIHYQQPSLPGNNNKPSIILDINSFPGKQGIIHDNKPVSDCSGSFCPGSYGNNGGTFASQPSLPSNNKPPSNHYPGQPGSIHDSNPISGCSGQSCTGGYGNIGGTYGQQPSLPGNYNKPSIVLDISSFPGQPSKPVDGCSGPSCPGDAHGHQSPSVTPGFTSFTGMKPISPNQPETYQICSGTTCNQSGSSFPILETDCSGSRCSSVSSGNGGHYFESTDDSYAGGSYKKHIGSSYDQEPSGQVNIDLSNSGQLGCTGFSCGSQPLGGSAGSLLEEESYNKQTQSTCIDLSNQKPASCHGSSCNSSPISGSHSGSLIGSQPASTVGINLSPSYAQKPLIECSGDSCDLGLIPKLSGCSGSPCDDGIPGIYGGLKGESDDFHNSLIDVRTGNSYSGSSGSSHHSNSVGNAEGSGIGISGSYAQNNPITYPGTGNLPIEPTSSSYGNYDDSKGPDSVNPTTIPACSGIICQSQPQGGVGYASGNVLIQKLDATQNKGHACSGIGCGPHTLNSAGGVYSGSYSGGTTASSGCTSGNCGLLISGSGSSSGGASGHGYSGSSGSSFSGVKGDTGSYFSSGSLGGAFSKSGSYSSSRSFSKSQSSAASSAFSGSYRSASAGSY